jgi:glycosyltransferase involved in cell wall biosynthesis
LVSIIIPAYNYGRFILETLESVRSQTFTDFECLVIDNGSTDNTKEIIGEILTDKRFKYFYQENKGVSAARNRGLREAKGKYVQFLDADDLIQRQKLEQSVNFLESNSSTHLVYSDMRYFRDGKSEELYMNYNCSREDQRPWMKYVSGSGKEMMQLFLKGNNMVISSPVFRAELTGEIGYMDESIGHNEDWDFWLRIVLAGKEFHFLDAPGSMTLVRIHKSSASLNVFKMQVGGLLVLMKNSEAIVKSGLKSLLDQRVIDHKQGIKNSLLQSDNKTFSERIAYLKEKNLFNLFFNNDSQNVWLSKLKLRFKRIS